MKTGVIYLYTFPNGKVYVGQTRRNPQIRHREHLDPKTGHLNKGFWQAYCEQGEPTYQILEEHTSEDTAELIRILNARETYYIHHFQATNPEYGYNVRYYGTESLRHNQKIDRLLQHFLCVFRQNNEPLFKSMEEKIERKELMTAEEKELYQEYFVEKNIFANTLADDEIYEEMFDFAEFCFEDDLQTMTEEYVYENLDQLLKEFIDNESIYQLSLDGKIVNVFESQYAAAVAMGAKNSANINNAVLGKQKTAYGYKWVKAEEYQGDRNTPENSH